MTEKNISADEKMKKVNEDNKKGSDIKKKDSGKKEDNKKDTTAVTEKNIIDSKLIFFRELVDFDKCIQAGFVQKVVIEQKIRNMICILCNDLEIYKPQEYDKDRVNQIERFLSILTVYHRVILPDIVQNALITETIAKVICRLEQILKI